MPVVRHLEIRNPTQATMVERLAYSHSHLVLQLEGNGDGPPQSMVIPRTGTDQSSGPTLVAAGERGAARFDMVWSLAGRGRSAPISRPKLKDMLPGSVEEVLFEAHPVALQRVRELPACRTLFEELVVSGNQMLSETFYAPPSAARTDDSCDFGALAYTHVGSPVTHLCAGFGRLTTDEAAIVLIHEALHYAGLEEAPFYEGALTSTEINLMVYSACGFDSPATAARPSP
jgi:hypothetical protein